jgi:hypothetical protein
VGVFGAGEFAVAAEFEAAVAALAEDGVDDPATPGSACGSRCTQRSAEDAFFDIPVVGREQEVAVGTDGPVQVEAGGAGGLEGEGGAGDGSGAGRG